MNKKIDDDFLAKWLNNQLTKNELEDFKKTSDYALYEKIMNVSSEFEEPIFEKEKVFEGIKESTSALLSTEKRKSKVYKLNWLSAAASVLIIFSALYFFNSSKSHETGYGEQLAIILPDSSEVLLNSKSSISFKKRDWESSRELFLKGEAHFKVKKGETFKVVTDLGEVKVLGTQFNVQSNKEYIEVHCFEGKVRVNSGKTNNILTKGKAVRNFNNGLEEKWNIDQEEPTWKNGETSFKSIALKFIVLSIENQYHIKIKTSDIDLTQKFTGSYTHDNLKVALKTVFEPMKIGVIFTDTKMVTLVKK
ncbi:FecR family protein [Tenacibaculum halocynthiae]|uniref:FecR family protein n=1 Tax=Tenacibaculum halocynthiae TaxID=1254437 RepID=UPI003894E952